MYCAEGEREEREGYRMNYFEGSWLLGIELAGGGWIKQYSILFIQTHSPHITKSEL